MRSVKKVFYAVLVSGVFTAAGTWANTRISKIAVNENRIDLTIETKPGSRYLLKGCADLAAGTWVGMGSSFLAEGTSVTRSVAMTESSCYYKAVEISGYISSISVSGATLTLVIDTIPTKRYQIESCTDLASNAWSELGESFKAGSNVVHRTVAMTASSCAYRVVEMVDPTIPDGTPPPPPR